MRAYRVSSDHRPQDGAPALCVRLHTDHPIEDTVIRELALPRSPGIMPDGALAVDLTAQEAMDLFRQARSAAVADRNYAKVRDALWTYFLSASANTSVD